MLEGLQGKWDSYKKYTFFIFPICIGPKLTLVTAVARWGINVLFLFC